MTIRFNSRFTFKRTGFKALSWNQFYEHVKNAKLGTDNDIWADLIDALTDGTLIQWLRRQNEELAKSIEQDYVTKKNLTNNEKLAIVVNGLITTLSPKQKKSVERLIKEEDDNLSKDKFEIGKNSLIFLSDTVSLEMIWVAPGSFDMGSNDDSHWEQPVHKVTITQGYWIGKYPLTQEQWKVIGCKKKVINYFEGARYPVESISWDEANAFCRKLCERFYEKIKGYRFDLPTEAQWEFAALGGEDHAKKHHYKYCGSANIDEVAWYVDNSRGKTQEVGRKKANVLGIYDMSGNVYEWCSDWFGEYSAEDQTDPLGPEEGAYRVLRGGSWSRYSEFCRTAYRGYGDPSIRARDLGFRVALVPVQ